jgi:hypothetical protein
LSIDARTKSHFQFVPQQLVFDAFAKPTSTGGKPELAPDHDFSVADPLLSTLRTCYSLTYYDSTLLTDPLSAITSIRALACNTLRQFTAELSALKLAPVGTPLSAAPVLLYKLVVAPSSIVSVAIPPSASKPADGIFNAIRTIITQTFSEVHGADDCARTLEKIRTEALKPLLDSNDLLDYLDLERVAPPKSPTETGRLKAFAADLPESVQHWWMDSPLAK